MALIGPRPDPLKLMTDWQIKQIIRPMGKYIAKSEKMMEELYKYPRTRHLEGSRKQAGDEDLNYVRFRDIRGKYLVLEEKIDGANCGISFGEDGRMYLQSRGHF